MDHIRQVFFCLCVFVVTACGGGGGSSAPPITVTVTPAMASVMFGEQIQLAATTTNTTGPVTWSSSNTAVATVDSTGLVMASLLNLGQVTITATSGEAIGTATLSITRGIEFSNVSAGSNHTCGVGSIPGRGAYYVAYCWGDNSSGQLGNGTTTNSATPVPVSGGYSFSTVSAGGDQTCGLTISGVAYCWGDNSSGQLGNGTMTNSSVPVPVTTGYISGAVGYYNSIISVSAGSSHTCGLARGNNGFIVYSVSVCWGDNSSGQLGNGTTTNSAVPVALSVDPGVSFSAGTLFTCTYSPGPNPAMFEYCWGNNGVGQLGNGTTTNSTTPVLISGDLSFTSISSGGMHACGVGASTYCWGDNSSGQLGNGTMTNIATPVAVASSLYFAPLSAGGSHTCGLNGANTGAVYCWGANTFGQLGNSWTTSSSVPVNVAGPP